MPPLAGVIFAARHSYGTSNARVDFKANAMPRALQNALLFNTFFGGEASGRITPTTNCRYRRRPDLIGWLTHSIKVLDLGFDFKAG